MTSNATALVIHPAPEQGLLESVLRECAQVHVLSAGPAYVGERDARIVRHRYPPGDDLLPFARQIQARYGIDVVVPAWEGAAEQSAVIARALGLAGNPPEAARAARDKGLAAERWRHDGVPHPRSALFPADPARIEAIEAEFGYPFVVKIPRSTNSQSVTLVSGRAELATALAAIDRLYQQAGPNRLFDLYGGRVDGRPVLVQQYVTGLELNIDLLYTEREHRVLGVFEKYPMTGPTFAEVQSVYPVALDGRQIEAAVATAVAAVRSQGATIGAAHVELRMSPDGPVVIESALRLGGFLTPTAIGRLTGVDPVAALVRLLATSELPELDPFPPLRACLYGAVNVTTAGRVLAIHGARQASAVPEAVLFDVLKKPGDQLVPLPEGTDYHFARFLLESDSRAEVEAAARRIRAAVTVDLAVA